MKHTRVQNSPKTGKVYVLFYEDDSAFSNFHPAKFEAATVKKLVNSEKFQEEETLKWNCSEQYFMYHKALLVNDQNAAKFIHDSKYPMPMKMAGRKLNMTRNDLEKWSEKSREVMYQACLAKFSQNLELRKLLFRTKGMILVEASGNDAIWGIGIWKEDPRAQNEDSWHGTNWLGIILDKIREELWDKPEFKNEKEEIEKENLSNGPFCEKLKLNVLFKLLNPKTTYFVQKPQIFKKNVFFSKNYYFAFSLKDENLKVSLLFFVFLKISNVSSIFTDTDKIYNETEARVLFELVAAVHNSQPQFCLKASFPNPQTRPKLITQFFVRCDHLNSDCTFALFELPGEQVVIAIRGTRTMSQLFFETMSAFIPDTSFHGLGEVSIRMINDHFSEK
ncbi:Protein CBG23827 [Caenorhabditis briggsae]|uniref:Protein CBG23827 n=1 Tax=Caenorhabditis briggsae TaxID=6238 RepID=A8WJE0_CAEBR|nr:Protein CBG23827 [Caenorhabditis briggsae]CAP20582.2 Protein CBG23827 [Caenorhabditis briggsae]